MNVDDHLTNDDILKIAVIDLAINDIIRELDETILDWPDGEVDRHIVIDLLRLAYLQGRQDLRLEWEAWLSQVKEI